MVEDRTKYVSPMDAAAAAVCDARHDLLGDRRRQCEQPGRCYSCLEMATQIVRAYLNRQLTP